MTEAECPVCHGTGKIGTTDWLTKNMSAKQLAKEKEEAVAEFNAKIRAEAIKEFAERVKEKLSPREGFNDFVNELLKIVCNKIDQIEKEMGVEL